MPNRVNLLGQTFGMLTVIGEGTIDGKLVRVCQCECGNICHRTAANLRQKKGLRSCGCQKKYRGKHGDYKTRLYSIWECMKRRCYNSNYYKWHLYGGKGIKVCDDWHDYLPFKQWALENGYAETLTIDRINSDLGYFPENCRWITQRENSARAGKKYTQEFKDKLKQEWATYEGTMTSFAKLHSIPRGTISYIVK